MTEEELFESVDPEHHDVVRGWLDRGDGCAVYENKAFDSVNFGHRKYTSFGSAQAQLEVDEPPQRLPDIGGQINWAYQLVGAVRRSDI